jgi:hypothetical protein
LISRLFIRVSDVIRIVLPRLRIARSLLISAVTFFARLADVVVALEPLGGFISGVRVWPGGRRFLSFHVDLRMIPMDACKPRALGDAEPL